MNLKRSEARIFIMNVHSGYAKPVLRTAQALGLIGPEYGWVVTDGTVKDAVRVEEEKPRKYDPIIKVAVVQTTSRCPMT
jgi:hypothetical protein